MQKARKFKVPLEACPKNLIPTGFLCYNTVTKTVYKQVDNIHLFLWIMWKSISDASFPLLNRRLRPP